MGWILFIMTVVAAAILGISFKRNMEDKLDALRASSRAELTDVRTEARDRVHRLEREAGRSKNDARDKLLDDLLPALDAIALAHASTADPEVRQGLELAINEFERALARHEIVPVEPTPGDAFDPELHEAVEAVETDVVAPGTIARLHRNGWKSADRVLRNAMVGVAKAPEVVLDNSDDDSEVEAEAPAEVVESS